MAEEDIGLQASCFFVLGGVWSVLGGEGGGQTTPLKGPPGNSANSKNIRKIE